MGEYQSGHILIVDDEELIRWALAEHLRGLGYDAREASDGQKALEAVAKDPPSLMLLDLRMPLVTGLDVLQALRERDVHIPVIVLTADGTVDSAVTATRLGARAYLTKPFDLEEVTRTVTSVLESERLAREVVGSSSETIVSYGDFIGQSSALRPVFDTVKRLEQVDAPTVLILGESGTGKDVIARMIHTRGPRKRGPFLDVDCASLPPALIESELFGHEKGAFTDAREAKKGLFEVAKGGVVFLDEIGELPIDTQVKLLRALESRTFRRVGGVKPIEFDAALLAATNRDLGREVANGRFREDLYFRLAIVPVRLPPLRERREDVPMLVSHFIKRCNQRFDRRIQGSTGEAMNLLQRYSWPGNVRELRNVIERIAILSPDDVIRAESLPAEIRWSRGGGMSVGCPFVLPDGGIDLLVVERGLIVQALERASGDLDATARLLSLTQGALRDRMNTHGLTNT